MPEYGCGLGKTAVEQRRQILIHSLRGIFEVVSLRFRGLEDGLLRKIELTENKFVWMNRFDIKLRKRSSREVLQVEGDDGIGLGLNRCRYNVAILWVGQFNRLNQ